MSHPHYISDREVFCQFQSLFLNMEEAILLSMVLFQDSPSWFVVESMQWEGQYKVTRDFVWDLFCKTHVPSISPWITYAMVQNATKYVVEFGHLAA